MNEPIIAQIVCAQCTHWLTTNETNKTMKLLLYMVYGNRHAQSKKNTQANVIVYCFIMFSPQSKINTRSQHEKAKKWDSESQSHNTMYLCTVVWSAHFHIMIISRWSAAFSAIEVEVLFFRTKVEVNNILYSKWNFWKFHWLKKKKTTKKVLFLTQSQWLHTKTIKMIFGKSLFSFFSMVIKL